MMKTLNLTIDGPSEYVIKTANGIRVRSLGEIQNLPLKVRNLIIKTNVQIIESSDSVFILGNNWMRKQSFEYDDEEEYESEELEEAQIYMSDFSGYSTEESLEFNPWKNEVSPAHQNNEDEELEESNPAIYLTQAEMLLLSLNHPIDVILNIENFYKEKSQEWKVKALYENQPALGLHL
ncbi:unnamed protein product [Rhizophagus irregularis]|nr:unnamed protein product [Rhizophagus irregularis]